MYCTECGARLTALACGTCYFCTACRMHFFYLGEAMWQVPVPAYYLFLVDDSDHHECDCQACVEAKGEELTR